MSFQEYIEYGATLSLLVVAAVDALKYGFLKAYFKSAAARFGWTAETAQIYYVMALTALSVAVGFMVALGAGEKANILTQLGFPQVMPVLGYLLTGLLLAFGNIFWSTVLDATKAISDNLKVWRDKQSSGLYEDETPANSPQGF